MLGHFFVSDPREQCTGTTKTGARCSAQAWRDGLCIWHHPDKAQDVAEARKRGGRNSSPTARAKKRFQGTEKDLAALWSKTMDAIEKVEAGELEVGQANAMANLIRAAQSLSHAVVFQTEIETLRQEIATIREGQGSAA